MGGENATEMKRRGELLTVSETKFEDLMDKPHDYAASWKRRAEAAEKEVESLRATLAEAAKKAEEKEGENNRAMGRVFGDLSHTREKLRVGEEEKKKMEAEVGVVRPELVQAEKKEEVEDVEMGAPARHLKK